ncbi:MAG: hypothetical protein J0H29_23040 [Sphingobacteriales bacterium]|nr:hypothetical protein [Sphingobacteriales bacterium]OJY81771.1 MAG: hypothetical protein BGP14_03105 [Sphingobacteriales bacterium 44-15]
MRRYILSVIIAGSFLPGNGQELYIMTEPASNMPAHSLGIRLTGRFMPMQYDNKTGYRIEPEIMFGINKHLMVHAAFYASNMFKEKFRPEGGSIYAKYRFLSTDGLHTHFRMAAFGKLSYIDNPPYIMHTVRHDMGGGIIHEEAQPVYSNEPDPDGNHSGIAGGIVATQLLHKLAISGSASYINRQRNTRYEKVPGLNNNAINYSLSAGYLLFPRAYKNYRQTNVNLYAEFLGSSGLDIRGNYIDIAPGIQFILNSISRIDIAWRTQLAGTMSRYNTTTWLLRYEYDFLNTFSKHKK